MDFLEPLVLPEGVDCRYWALPAAGLPNIGSFLTAEEQALRATFGHPRRREGFAMGRLVARSLVGDRLEMSWLDVPLVYDDEGAPCLEGWPHHLSMTHTDEAAAAILGDRPVGIDLEVIRPRRPDLYKFLLHENEYRLLEEIQLPREALMILIWTLKEAVLKGQRTGFRQSPKKLQVEIDVEAGVATIALASGAYWEARFVHLGNAYLSAAFPALR